MDAFVLDVSACIPWCCEDETTPASEQMLEWAMDGSAVPSLWTWEILNTVAVVIKRQRITAGSAREFLEQLATLNIKIAQPPPIADFPRLHSLAGTHQLTAYDVAYLDLAKRLSLPLATRDDDLKRAARAEGVQILCSARHIGNRTYRRHGLHFFAWKGREVGCHGRKVLLWTNAYAS